MYVAMDHMGVFSYPSCEDEELDRETISVGLLGPLFPMPRGLKPAEHTGIVFQSRKVQ